jgi:hypothetical protein
VPLSASSRRVSKLAFAAAQGETHSSHPREPSPRSRRALRRRATARLSRDRKICGSRASPARGLAALSFSRPRLLPVDLPRRRTATVPSWQEALVWQMKCCAVSWKRTRSRRREGERGAAYPRAGPSTKAKLSPRRDEQSITAGRLGDASVSGAETLTVSVRACESTNNPHHHREQPRPDQGCGWRAAP